jgi:hypothetical protein
MTRDELVAILNSGEYCILTAWRENAPFHENVQNVRLLRDWLRKDGHNPITCIGRYDGKREQSLLVPGLAEWDALPYAGYYYQESILDGRVGLVYCEDGRLVPLDGTLSIDGGEDDYFSVVVCDDGTHVQFAVGLDWSE